MDSFIKLVDFFLEMNVTFSSEAAALLFLPVLQAGASIFLWYCHAEARSICFIGCRCFVPQHDSIFEVAAKQKGFRCSQV